MISGRDVATPFYSGLVSAIEMASVSRLFRSRQGAFRRRVAVVEALQDVSFSVEPGELFGLLGPNGAGKTTSIKILTTLLLPTSGSVRVLGFDPVREPNEVRSRVGYVFGGDRGLYDRLSALDNLRYFADVYRVPARRKAARIAELLELVGLTGRERDRVETYSRGMRQRLHIARGLLHDPPVIFLDEPTIGLDPVGARELRETVAALRDSGKTILLTTHYMFEADELCSRVAVINKGRIVAEGTPGSLKAGVRDRTVIEVVAFNVSDVALEAVRRLDGVDSLAVEAKDQTQVLSVQSALGVALIQPLLGTLAGAQVTSVTAREPTLEDAYVQLVSEL
jgi:ABC-2 type transport system ATP-binding protein